MRVMGGHNARVPSLSWNGHVLSSGCRDGSIHHHDVRVAKHKVMELMGHNAEVSSRLANDRDKADSPRCAGCRGVRMGSSSPVEETTMLSTAGSECPDHIDPATLLMNSGRIGQSVLQTGEGTPRGTPKWTKRNHNAAVKVSSMKTTEPELRPQADTSRLWLGAHGSPVCSPREADPLISKSIFGHAPPALEPARSLLNPRSLPSSGHRIRKRSCPLTGSPKILYRSGATLLWKRSTT